MSRLRLRYIGVADFRKSELGMLEDLRKTHPEIVKRLRGDDVVMLRSGRGDQVTIVHGFVDADEVRGNERRVLRSQNLRITWGSWSPSMIVDYARMMGIKLAQENTLSSVSRAVDRLRKAWGLS